MVVKLLSAFATGFEDLRNCQVDFQIFAHPFDLAVENIPDCFQFKMIALQENLNFKRAYIENDLLTFYRRSVYRNYKNFLNHTKKCSLVLGARTAASSSSLK